MLKSAGGSRELNHRVSRQDRVRLVPQSLGREKDDHLRRSVGLAAGRKYAAVEQTGDAGAESGATSLRPCTDWDSWPGRPTSRSLPKLVDPYDESADLDRRARSYLQTNCCALPPVRRGRLGEYRPWLTTCRWKRPRPSVSRPIQGTFNIAGARIIAPGDPAGSVLYYRDFQARRRPHAAHRLESRSTSARRRMIHDWIARMPRAKAVRTRQVQARPAEDRCAIGVVAPGRPAVTGRPSGGDRAVCRQRPAGP